jgi:biotin operon repressor
VADPAILTPRPRLLPTPGKRGPVSALATLQPGEIGSDALTRIGAAVLPLPGKGAGGGRPKKLPRQLAAVLALNTEGMGVAEIAERLNMSAGTVRKVMQKARRDHGLDDVVDRVKNRAIPQAVDNLIEGLDKQDREYTTLVLKNTLFRQDKTDSGDKGGNNVLVVRIEMPVIPAGAPTVALGSIQGTPRSMKVADIIEAETV